MMKKLEAELRRYANSDMYPFHMPGHKRRGDEIHQIDITEIDGFDNLHDPQDLILGEMREAAEFYGTRDTFFSVNGSTCAILTAISAAVPFGGTLLVERGCHISVYHAAYLRHLHLIYIEDPEKIREKAEDQEKDVSFEGRNKTDEPDAVMITSPSYEGCVKQVEFWAEFAHQRGIPLIVDEAHGAHFSMHPYFPKSAIQKGADLVIQSVHKTLPAMTQTALLHNVTGRVSSERLEAFLDIYETSSPSYVLMASITSCLHLVMDPNQDLFDRYADALKMLRRDLSKMKHLRLLGGEKCILREGEFPPYPAGTKTDPGKIAILTKGTTITGPELYDRLREEYSLQPEMKTPDLVLLMTSVYDTAEGFERLENALLQIDSETQDATSVKNTGMGEKVVIPENFCTIAEAMDDPGQEKILLGDAEGRISAGYVIVFPPDAPVIVPGERYSRKIIAEIQRYLSEGLSVTGVRNGKVEVLKSLL